MHYKGNVILQTEIKSLGKRLESEDCNQLKMPASYDLLDIADKDP